MTLCFGVARRLDRAIEALAAEHPASVRRGAPYPLACFFMRHIWKPSVSIAFSITAREMLCGGALVGPTMPVTVHGPCCFGSLAPAGSLAKACSSFRVSDLKM